MSTIPTSLTEKEFNERVNPYLSKAKRGFICKIPLYKVFNYILHRLHTGCQWDQLPMASDPHTAEKKKSVGMRCIITIVNGRETAV
jgi:transposase